jgi:hypothetical protein
MPEKGFSAGPVDFEKAVGWLGISCEQKLGAVEMKSQFEMRSDAGSGNSQLARNHLFPFDQ